MIHLLKVHWNIHGKILETYKEKSQQQKTLKNHLMWFFWVGLYWVGFFWCQPWSGSTRQKSSGSDPWKKNRIKMLEKQSGCGSDPSKNHPGPTKSSIWMLGPDPYIFFNTDPEPTLFEIRIQIWPRTPDPKPTLCEIRIWPKYRIQIHDPPLLLILSKCCSAAGEKIIKYWIPSLNLKGVRSASGWMALSFMLFFPLVRKKEAEKGTAYNWLHCSLNCLGFRTKNMNIRIYMFIYYIYLPDAYLYRIWMAYHAYPFDKKGKR